MKSWICRGLAAAALTVGLGVSDASAFAPRYRVGMWPGPVVVAPRYVVAPPVMLAPPMVVAPPVYVVPRRYYVAPPAVVVPAPAPYYYAW